jgi:hypothetical protein
MRVLCSALDGSEVEGFVIGGEVLNAELGSFDLDATFKVRCDDGEVFKVNGWQVLIVKALPSLPICASPPRPPTAAAAANAMT